MRLQEEGGPGLSGSNLDLSAASQLTDFQLEHSSLSGTLTLPPAAAEVDINDAPISNVAAPRRGVPDLTLLKISNSSLTGEVPQWLLEAPKLQLLVLADNNFTSLPQGWQSKTLGALDVSNNAITVRFVPNQVHMYMLQGTACVAVPLPSASLSISQHSVHLT